jgi:hypothetical protein
MNEKIIKYFKENELPKPVTINHIGRWAKGECYAVTCGIFKLKKYCVYCVDNEINNVRFRG